MASARLFRDLKNFEGEKLEEIKIKEVKWIDNSENIFELSANIKNFDFLIVFSDQYPIIAPTIYCVGELLNIECMDEFGKLSIFGNGNWTPAYQIVSILLLLLLLVDDLK